MARIIDYEQDEDKPFGVGTHYLDDGTSYYLDDPERARSVLEELYGKSDVASDVGRESTNIAERGSIDRKGEQLDTKSQLENAIAKLAGASEPNKPFQGIDVGPSRMRRAVAGPGGGDEPTESREETESRAPVAEEMMSHAPAPEPTAPSEGELREADAARRWQNADSLVSRTKKGTDPRTLGPGVRVDKSYSRKGGLPTDEYDQQSQGRALAYQAGNELVAQHYREDEAANNLAASRVESEALAQRKANAQQALALQKKDDKYQADRSWLEKDVDDYYDKSKVDPDRRKKDRGVFGNLATVVAQFMGAYAATITGAPNFANQILNRKIDADIDAQLEDFRRGKMKRDGQLQRMAERGMSLDQMKGALKVQQELALQKEVKAAALREGTRESKQAAESLLMDRQERFINAENDFRTKALGEETVSGEMVRPTGPKAKTPLELAKERNELLEADLKGQHLAHGGDYAVAAEERADKRAERGAARDDKLNAGVRTYADTMAKEGAPLKKVRSAIDRLDAINREHGGLPGVGGLEYRGFPGTAQRKVVEEVEQLQQTIVNSLIQANPGSASEGDAQRLAVEAFGKGTQASALDGMANARAFIDSKLSSIDASATPEERAEYQRREDAVRLEARRKELERRQLVEDEERKKKRGGR